jgi:DNA-binding transcriptional ArsR family regulator
MSDAAVLAAIADALESAVRSLRASAALIAPSADDRERSHLTLVERVRSAHPALGPRQAQVLEVLERAGSQGISTGAISKEMGYDQPNVYLTLQGLVSLGYVQKNEASRPHRYSLSEQLIEVAGIAAA